MIINGKSLLKAAPIIDMVDKKIQTEPCSWGLTECGYDIRIKQDIMFTPQKDGNMLVSIMEPEERNKMFETNFILASSIEEFKMPNNLMGQVLNKSTWARQGLDASMTTNIEPGWFGWLTLELTYHGSKKLHIPAGSGIAQVMFHEIMEPRSYQGKYQNQADQPVKAETGPVCIMDQNGVYPERLDPFVQQQCNHIWELLYDSGLYKCLSCGNERSKKP